MPIEATRTFRLGVTVAVALLLAYGSGLALPFLVPLLAFLLAAQPTPPPGLKKLLGLAVALTVMLGMGLFVAPIVEGYTLMGIALVAVGLFVSARFSLGGEKVVVGTLMAAGLTLISAVGVLSLGAAQFLVLSLTGAVVMAVVSQWLVYPLFPEPLVAVNQSTKPTAVTDSAPEILNGPPSNCPAGVPLNTLRKRAWRSVAVVMPAYLFLLTNPAGNTPVMMKSIVLSQTDSHRNAREAGIELLGATCLGGLLAVGLWFGLKLAPTLPLFFLWILLAFLWIGKGIFDPAKSRFSQQFWIDVGVTCLILLGPAVADSANGKDPYQAFLFRFGMFLLVAVYAWGAMRLIDHIFRRNTRSDSGLQQTGAAA